MTLRPPDDDLHLGDLGSGSDYTPFLQHNGVPSTDIGSDGPFSVYHTVFDNYDWFTRFADPDFSYTQQQARFFGLEILHMADADVLPLDYEVYAHEIHGYLDLAHSRAADCRDEARLHRRDLRSRPVHRRRARRPHSASLRRRKTPRSTRFTRLGGACPADPCRPSAPPLVPAQHLRAG